MNDCADGQLRDLLPDYVHHTLRAAERATVAAHLERCADCRAEVTLITAASRAFAGPDVDVAAIIKALPGAPRPVIRRTFVGRAQRIAAAIGVIAIGAFSVIALRGKFGAKTHPVATSGHTTSGAATELASARPARPAPAAVESPAHAVRPAAPAVESRPAMSFGGGLSDLSDDQLDTLLGELDDLDALPSAEPETHLTPILPPADGGHGAR